MKWTIIWKINRKKIFNFKINIIYNKANKLFYLKNEKKI